MDKQVKKEVKRVAKKAAKKRLKKISGKHSAALNYSPYLRTLLDAVNCVGVKIPDAVTTPSFCAQGLTKVISPTVTATGGIGVGYARLLGSTNSTSGGQATIVPSATTAGVYTPTSTTNPWAPSLTPVCQSMRLVSAKMTATYLGSPNNASGRIVIAFIPPGDASFQWTAGGALTAALSLSGLAARLTSADVPASKLYAEARYIPIDPLALTYEVTGSIAASTNRNGQPTYGSFVCLCDGFPTGQSVEFNIWENYECLPITSTVNLCAPSASHSDPLELAAVSNLIADAPQIPIMQSSDQLFATAQAAPLGTMSQVASAMSPGSRRVEHNNEPSFLDKVMSGLDKATDVALKATPLVGMIASML